MRMPIISPVIRSPFNRRGSSGLNGAPSGLAAAIYDETIISLSTTLGSTNEDGSEWYYSPDGVIWWLHGTTGHGISTYAAGGLITGVTYYFKMRTYKGLIYSDFTSVVTATPNIVDADGNIYTSVAIGTQTWLLQNLQTTKYNDGSSITNGNALSNAAWAALTTEAFCYPAGDAGNKVVYGLLYNWFVVSDAKGVCPRNYHLPTQAEVTTLNTLLGGATVAGGKLKETGTTHWKTPNPSDNSSHFTFLPNGLRSGASGVFGVLSEFGAIFSTTASDASNAYRYIVRYDDDDSAIAAVAKASGQGIRCIRNS